MPADCMSLEPSYSLEQILVWADAQIPYRLSSDRRYPPGPDLSQSKPIPRHRLRASNGVLHAAVSAGKQLRGPS